MQEQEIDAEYKGVATQPAGVPDPMGFSLTPPSGMNIELIGVSFLASNYAAARTLKITAKSDTAVVMLLASVSQDNNQSFLPSERGIIDATSEVAATVGKPHGYTVGDKGSYRFEGIALAEAETLSLFVKMKLRGAITAFPTVTAVGSGVVLSGETKRFI